MTKVPFDVVGAACRLTVSPSRSVAVIVPLTRPVTGLVDRLPALALVGAAFLAPTVTVMGMVMVAPRPSEAVMVKESVLSEAAAPSAAAAWRASALGV